VAVRSPGARRARVELGTELSAARSGSAAVGRLPKPRSYEQKINRKMYKAAMRSLLSELVRQERLMIVESIEVEEPKTRLMVDRLKEFGLDSGLFVVEAFDEKLHLASRNLPHVEVLEVTALDPVSLLRYEKIVISVAAVRRLEEKLV